MAFFEWHGLKNKLGLRPQTEIQDIGSGPATKCEKCGEVLMRVAFEANLKVCPHCQHHHILSSAERLQTTLDYGTFKPLPGNLAAKDILEFKGIETYQAKLVSARKKTQMLDAMLAGTGEIKGQAVAIGVTDARFMAGSMGSVVGELFVRLVELAVKKQLPLVVFSGSGGGARMYEGLFSLFQMAKTAAALVKLEEARLPFISVCTQSTMGGVWASWAALGDIVIAEPQAQIGFTGPRVIKTTINAELPAGFQSSEFLLARGQIDQIVPRADLRERLASILDLLQSQEKLPTTK
ncbi:MAG: acetyl-CoA carboxylase, carboxyltransferase subunit beta [Planctomycetota bacterium]|jgi:acetyl-CoA carboxylase carboxyl transferase subunit beta|nr:acetyl-CoA carboxylase, carboxyltransferase subunit beta [Planctomycetota bacterium]